jgi:hypothetical protein
MPTTQSPLRFRSKCGMRKCLQRRFWDEIVGSFTPISWRPPTKCRGIHEQSWANFEGRSGQKHVTFWDRRASKLYGLPHSGRVRNAAALAEGISTVNCREALEHFGQHVDGELTSLERWRLQLHLWICGHCRKYLRSYRTTVEAERAAFKADGGASPEVPHELVKRILSAADVSPPSGEGNPRPPAK